MKPPSAQSEPNFIVLQRSSSSFDIGGAVLVLDDAVDHLDAARRADPAGRALAAGFDRAEFHREARLLGHVDRVVEHHDAAMADQAVARREGLVVERRIEQRAREIGAERPADLHRAHRPAAARAAADIVDQFAERDAERGLEQAAIFDIAGELDRHRAARTAHAEVAIERGALVQNDRHRGEREHIVDHGRAAEQALDAPAAAAWRAPGRACLRGCRAARFPRRTHRRRRRPALPCRSCKAEPATLLPSMPPRRAATIAASIAATACGYSERI